MSFQRTTAINKILALKKFIRGIQGGSSAGKTYGIIPILIDKCCKQKDIEVSIVSESIPHLKRGAIRDFKKIMTDTGRWIDAHWNATDFKYNFSNNSFIEFFSTNDYSKLRGARRDWLYMNEANNQTFNSYTELASRTKQGVFLDWNPTNPFWFHDELQNDSDVDYITITYFDNEACPQAALNFILKAKEKSKHSSFWDNWYKVYGLGLIGTLQGIVFDNWIQKDLPTGTDGKITATFIAFGLDFGFTNDPTALIGAWKQDGEIYLKQFIYETRLTNSDIVAKFRMLEISQQAEIIADSAEPKSIEDIRRSGYNITGAKKGKDSIKSSIDTLRQFKINITPDSIDLIKEMRSYKWQADNSGKSTNNPVDFMNHCIDASRYIALNKLTKASSGEYSMA